MSDEKKRDTWQPPGWFHVAGLVTAVLAVAATAYFSVRAERTKELTLRYFGQRPLLSLESRASSGLAITLGGERLEAPWLLSGRLENTGSQPIEARDIERPLQIAFARGRVVAAEIVEKSQQAVFASVTHSGSAVILGHTLLNPRDWVSFDILLDGEPSSPVTSVRISGVSQLQEVVTSSGERQVFVTIFPVPGPVVYLALVLGSVVGLGTTVFGLVLLGNWIRELVWPGSSFGRQSGWGDPETLALNGLEPQGRKALILFIALTETDPPHEGMRLDRPLREGHRLPNDWLDNPVVLSQEIASRIPSSLLQALGLNLSSAAALLSRELKESLKRRLAFFALPRILTEPDSVATRELRDLDVTKLASADLIAKVKEIVQTTATKYPQLRRPRGEMREVGAGFFLLILGLPLILVLGGTWRTVLGL